MPSLHGCQSDLDSGIALAQPDVYNGQMFGKARAEHETHEPYNAKSKKHKGYGNTLRRNKQALEDAGGGRSRKNRSKESNTNEPSVTVPRIGLMCVTFVR